MIQVAFRHGLWEVLANRKVTWRPQGEIDRGRLFKSGSEKPVHGDSPLVAESGAWCNDLGGR